MKKIIFFLAISLMLVACSPTQSSLDEYNGYKFYEDADGFWITKLSTFHGDDDVPFYFHPSEVDNLTYNNSINDYMGFIQRNGGRVLLGLDPNFPERYDAVAAVEIGKITGRVFGIETRSGFVSSVEELPVHNCSVANPQNFVIELRQGNFTGVESKDFCAIITTEHPRDILKGANLMGYKLLGIIPLE